MESYKEDLKKNDNYEIEIEDEIFNKIINFKGKISKIKFNIKNQIQKRNSLKLKIWKNIWKKKTQNLII